MGRQRDQPKRWPESIFKSVLGIAPSKRQCTPGSAPPWRPWNRRSESEACNHEDPYWASQFPARQKDKVGLWHLPQERSKEEDQTSSSSLNLASSFLISEIQASTVSLKISTALSSFGIIRKSGNWKGKKTGSSGTAEGRVGVGRRQLICFFSVLIS